MMVKLKKRNKFKNYFKTYEILKKIFNIDPNNLEKEKLYIFSVKLSG